MNPIATFELKNGEIFRAELLPEAAPNTVNSFIYLARLGCYDNYAIQRIVPHSWIDLSYSAFGKPEARYFIDNEAPLQHHQRITAGMMCMGGYSICDIAGGELFFPLRDCPDLEGCYPVLGLIREGMDVLEGMADADTYPVTIASMPDVEIHTPVTPIVIAKVTVETFGVAYPMPRRRPPIPCPEKWR